MSSRHQDQKTQKQFLLHFWLSNSIFPSRGDITHLEDFFVYIYIIHIYNQNVHMQVTFKLVYQGQRYFSIQIIFPVQTTFFLQSVHEPKCQVCVYCFFIGGQLNLIAYFRVRYNIQTCCLARLDQTKVTRWWEGRTSTLPDFDVDIYRYV